MHRTQQILAQLRAYESRNITFLDPDGTWPIVWERARGVHVWDAEEKKYLDLTAAFGVAAAGHANPRVVQAGQRQMARLLHAMGDVHPHALKAQLARELSRLTFARWGRFNASTPQRFNASTPPRAKTIFCNSGFEAVEAALKTALLATGKPGIIAFEGAYHGLGYGALNATHRDFFRGPFRSQLAEFAHFVPFPLAAKIRPIRPIGPIRPIPPTLQQVQSSLQALFRRHPIGAILVEPIQARGGIRIPPPGFLPMLRRLCDEHHALLILDEIYTGLGRTGKWFACEHTRTVPDVICLGKALTGGFPLSACVGRADLMDTAWQASTGEAIHTSTFLGHPVGCAMALAQIAEIKKQKLVARSACLGGILARELAAIFNSQFAISNFQFPISNSRGLGLMAGLDLLLPDGSPATDLALRAIKTMLHRGFILLPEGEHANVISFTPPLTITETQLRQTIRALADTLRSLSPASTLQRFNASAAQP